MSWHLVPSRRVDRYRECREILTEICPFEFRPPQNALSVGPSTISNNTPDVVRPTESQSKGVVLELWRSVALIRKNHNKARHESHTPKNGG